MYASDEGTQPIYWGIESKGMREKFKDSPNSARSRFDFVCPQLDSSTRLEIHHSGNAPSPLPLLALRTVRPPPRRIHLAIVSMLKEATRPPNDPDLLVLLRAAIDAMPTEGRGLLWHQSDTLLDVMAGAMPEAVAERISQLRTLHTEANSLQHFELMEQRLQSLLAGRKAPVSAPFAMAHAVPSDVCI
jgi:hypothetical protein